MKNSFFLEPDTTNTFIDDNGTGIMLTADFPKHSPKKKSEILIVTSYPPRECGIATYSNDLVKALKSKFGESMQIRICAVENNNEKHIYSNEIRYVLNTDQPNDYIKLANVINTNDEIKIVLIQHEFGFYVHTEQNFIGFLKSVKKKKILAFHTVLPHPDEQRLSSVTQIADEADNIIVMTHSSAHILERDYRVPTAKISIIPHGTHLVSHSNKASLKHKYGLDGKTVLSTFGLLSSGKNIETTLEALPEIIAKNKNVLFLIIGKTHPGVVKHEGERYRTMLENEVTELNLSEHVKFLNSFLPLPELLEYLQLTDVYLFTSKDPNQAVSGTFSYAISCGCPVISTPIPHATEVLKDNGGMIVDFENSKQLSEAVNKVLSDKNFRQNIIRTGLQRMAPTAWENAAIAHAHLFEQISSNILLQYILPPIKLTHLKKMTIGYGMVQFAQINQPDLESGYTLDDNARALIVMCQHFELSMCDQDLNYISLYLNFIGFCQQSDGSFLNYVDKHESFTEQNYDSNLQDANGRAIWALGYLLSLGFLLPDSIVAKAESIYEGALQHVASIHSSRAMGFIIKGIYYRNQTKNRSSEILLLTSLAERLMQMYLHESDNNWQWFESYLTYANAILPEAMLCAFRATGNTKYRNIAKTTFDFLLTKLFQDNTFRVISNKQWLHKASEFMHVKKGGEQPIDVAYTISALEKFYADFRDEFYKSKITQAINWFLGANHLQQIIYNPCTGGCYDGLEEHNINLNQGAESTISYLMARLAVEKLIKMESLNRSKIHLNYIGAIKTTLPTNPTLQVEVM